jgi:hypothetical protein
MVEMIGMRKRDDGWSEAVRGEKSREERELRV